jgi:hypothetical protein
MEDAARSLGVKGTDPARSELKVSSCQNQMIHHNGDINVIIALAIAPNPSVNQATTSTDD